MKSIINPGVKMMILLFCFQFNALNVVAAEAPAVDNRIFADLLGKYITDGGVNYKGLKSDEARLDQYLKVLENTDSRKLEQADLFAFYINAYNAWTIKLILSAYPEIESIKDLGTFLKTPWKKKICRLDGNVVSLDYVEHKILRPRFKDPRVHFAINCAAFSCPPLRFEPYQGNRLNEQLNHSTRMFINNPDNNYIREDTLYVSKIFKWFKDDFNNDIIGFFLKYADGNFKKALETQKSMLKIKYLRYDWSLNGK